MMRLRDKVAIVTGGGKGIGKAVSLAFASEGATVVVAARSLAQLDRTAEEIRSKGGKVLTLQTDVADEESVKQMVAKTINEFGWIDILVNNSGITGPVSSVVDMDLQAWKETLTINLTGAMLCSREVLKHMIPRKSGTIIMMSSEGGRGCDGKSGYPRRSAYTCSKIAMIGLTESMSVEVGEYGIRVNAISPAGVIGDRIRNILKGKAEAMGTSPEDLMSKAVTNYSLGRFAEESEVASATVFLASSESSAMTGQTLVVNCGHHILH
jgi:NAD(P)-dependent dehydrogenase (short-subunit alcohol dehydrogenase family)